jgi:hypothetical protein
MAELLLDKRIQKYLMERMGNALIAAQQISPKVTGYYMSRLHLEADETDRVVARLVNDADYAMSVEAADGVLSRALDAAGGKAQDPSKIKVRYTTKSGKQIWATQAQVDNWTRGGRS